MTDEKRKKFISNDVFVGAFMSIISIAFGVQTFSFRGTSKYFPVVVFSVFVLLSLIEVFWGVSKTIRVRQGLDDYTNPEIKAKPFLLLGTMLVYIFCFGKIGFFVSSAIYLPTTMLIYGQRNWKAIILTTIGVLAFLYWMFIVQMQLHMPKTLLF